jgi:hypothetical protein
MKDLQEARREDPDKVLIDRYIDWREMNQPENKAPIKTNLHAEALYYVLGIPAPENEEEEYSDSVFYRGYLILAKLNG